MNPIKSSLRYPAVTLVLTAMVVAVGVHAFLVMPRMEDPDVTVRTGLVLAAYPGATSEQVEEQVTKPLEERIFKFPEVRKEKTFSTSRPGLVIVNVELEDSVTEADVFWSKLRHDMNEAGATVLPQGIRGPIVNSDFGSTVAVLMAIHGQRYGYRELRDYADRLQDELRTIRDIGKMATYGEQSEQIRITSSLERMSQYFADPLRVIQALQQRNIIQSSGSFNAEAAKVPLRTTGLFTTEEEIRHVLVDISRTGQPVYIRDFADVERKYQDPTFLVRYDGEPSVLLSIEMQKGKNIVQLGEQIDVVLQRAKTMLPPDLKLDLIANQPEVVKTRLSDLSHEFMLAIGSVILVTLILLPFRVAVIAALAIPVTICATLAVLDAIGIQLHQVTIAALIVVLGIVVDDAIVIADNYVELLDRKVPKAEAAWKCATEVVVPVLTATLTIISSFLPLLILSGSAGEFIRALPITVAVALSVSFVVAVMLTPLLCRFFIQKGLHDDESSEKKKFSLLDQLQSTYNKAIVFLMGRKPLALIIGGCAIIAGGLLLSQVPEQFFPTAERNQFVIDVWMPQGSRIEATDDILRRIEKQLRANSEVAHFASFAGQSAPRFYYNVNPQQPDGAYGQLIVNTKSEKETPALVADLRISLAKTAPEAMVIVKELQQGSLMEAPVEVRISGDDTEELKKLGKAVEDMFRAVPFTQLVHNDFYNDSYRVDVDVNTELSNRLGLSNSNVSMMLAGAFDGAPVSTFWEGNRPVTIVLRLDDSHRTSFENVRDAYVTSAITKASVPLRSIATLEPQWQTSRIVRRNGVQTMTVRGFVSHGHYGSELLKATESKIKDLKLPPGYSISYGGEKANRDETFPQMVVALAISVIAIFLILLIQFRTISEPLVVMSSIPLALFGAAFGLIVTRNPFGFTAFMGLISLAGIVVRNAIILIDYINEKIREGHPLEQAATEAGERRLRPIFLTTMAAAVGVTPMILSGSSLWSPLASVIAVGLIFSMFFTLLVVPVLFVIVQSRVRKPAATAAIVALALLASGSANAATREITLQEAIDLAVKQNSMAKIARAKVRESQQKQTSAWADYFPQLSSDATLFGTVNRQFITIPAGGLGAIPGLGPFPPSSVSFNQGSNALLLTNTTLGQPLTQLLKIRAANRIAASDRNISETDQKRAEDEIVLGVHQLYYGLLAATKVKDAAQAQVSAGEEALREAETAVSAGNVLEVAAIGRRAALLQAKQSFLAAENQIADLTVEMNHLIGIPLDTQLSLAPLAADTPPVNSREEYLKTALTQNPEVQAAIQTVEKARQAISIARYDFIPEIGAFGRYTYQNGIPFLAHNNGSFGLQMTWNIFDWGKRSGVVGQREAQLEQAEENLRRLKDGVAVDLEKAYRKLERTKQMIEVATEALALQRESERLSGNQLKAGVTSEAKNAEAIAATRKAEADEFQARLAYRLAQAELAKIASTPR